MFDSLKEDHNLSELYIREAHKKLGISSEHFKFFVETMADILKELNIDNLQLQKEVIEWLGRTKNDVLNKKYEEK